MDAILEVEKSMPPGNSPQWSSYPQHSTWCQMKRITFFNVKNQDTSLNIVLTLGAMNVMSRVIIMDCPHTKYLLLEHQWDIIRHTEGHHARLSLRHHWEDQEKWSRFRSQSHYERHCSLSHHNSHRGCSRSQHWDRHSYTEMLMMISLSPQRTHPQTLLWHNTSVTLQIIYTSQLFGLLIPRS